MFPGEPVPLNRLSTTEVGDDEMKLSLYREYREIVGRFTYVVEDERRFCLANAVEMVPRNTDGSTSNSA